MMINPRKRPVLESKQHQVVNSSDIAGDINKQCYYINGTTIYEFVWNEKLDDESGKVVVHSLTAQGDINWSNLTTYYISDTLETIVNRCNDVRKLAKDELDEVQWT